MNEADIKVKQQIVDKVKSSTNILITVSKNPSVDDLSAAIGLAALLNKLDKHATAIFSGSIPSAITFLNPDKVFESTADSLRDFIIALDKEKADHLRYKVEGDVVKIFITPYRTTIDADDLEFSQGDFNVELVLALGVESQESLDAALESHGRILHDVTVATFSANGQASQLGSIDWRDEGASSLCEMVANISNSFKSDKSLLDKQIATALLTGIVAATDRFSNTKTTPGVMTMAAQLMAAGADQQLIAAKLQESHTINTITANPNDSTDSSTIAPSSATPTATVEYSDDQSTLPPADGSLDISHDVDTTVDQIIDSVPIDTNVSTLVDASDSIINNYPTQTQPIDYSTSTLPPVPATMPAMPSYDPPVIKVDSIGLPHEKVIEPLLGGTLNATADLAAEDARRELEDQQNKTLLSHSYLGAPETIRETTPINSIGLPEPTNDVDIFADGPLTTMPNVINLPPPPPLPDFSVLPPPPLPDFNVPSTLPDMNNVPTMAVSNDPSQFRIPGQ